MILSILLITASAFFVLACQRRPDSLGYPIAVAREQCQGCGSSTPENLRMVSTVYFFCSEYSLIQRILKPFTSKTRAVRVISVLIGNQISSLNFRLSATIEAPF